MEPYFIYALYECLSCGLWNINYICENNKLEEWEPLNKEASKDEIIYNESRRIYKCSFYIINRKY